MFDSRIVPEEIDNGYLDNKRIVIYLIAVFYLMLYISCINKQSHKQQAEKEQKAETKTTEKTDSLALSKLSPEKVAEKFGKPLKTDFFDLSEPLSEFRIEIYNCIADNDQHSAKIKIKEYTWTYNNIDNITIWYQFKQGKLVFLHYNIWPKDASF